MTTEPNDELTPGEPEAYASLRESCTPPRSLEEDVVTALRARGLVATRSGGRAGRALRWAAAVAAGILLFIAGVAIGQKGVSTSEPPGGPRFVLLLHEDATYQEPPPGKTDERVDEYRRWAGRLAEAGHFVTGEKLTSDGSLLARTGAGSPIGQASLAADDTIAGFFIISADSYESALALARDCPHLLHGGRIEVRPIDPT